MAAPTSICFRFLLASALLTASVFAEVTAAAGAQSRAPVPPGVPEPPPPSADLAEVETIIPESELQTEVPSLPLDQDNPVQAPLEEIEEFEQRLSAPLDVEGVVPASDPELNRRCRRWSSTPARSSSPNLHPTATRQRSAT